MAVVEQKMGWWERIFFGEERAERAEIDAQLERMSIATQRIVDESGDRSLAELEDGIENARQAGVEAMSETLEEDEDEQRQRQSG